MLENIKACIKVNMAENVIKLQIGWKQDTKQEFTKTIRKKDGERENKNI